MVIDSTDHSVLRYGNQQSNERFQHWDHEVLPHWTETENRRYPTIGTRFSPPDNLHSPFYPSRGPYSSTDPALLLDHFTEIREMGRRGNGGQDDVVVVLSWWGQASLLGTSDTQGIQTDDRIAAALAAASAANMTVAWHLEPYPGRSASSVAGDVDYIERRYGSSRAVCRLGPRGTMVFFVYDSYHVPAAEWATVLRGPLQGAGLFIGLWLEAHHGHELSTAGLH